MVSKGKGITAFVLGICGMIFWIIPLLGYPITIIGLILAASEMKKGAKGIVIAAFVLTIIGLVLTVANSAIGAYLGVASQLS